MPNVTLSSKYQIVIPKEIRRQLKLKSGQKLTIFVKERIISLVPDHPLKEFKGYLRGMNTEELREEKDRI